MTYIEVIAPEGHLWQGRRVQVCGAAADAILTLFGTFNWSGLGRRWVWICDHDVALVWPGPDSSEHAALVASFDGPALLPRIGGAV